MTTKSSKPLRKDELRPDGVTVLVDWDKFVVGSSFFVPCIDTANCREQVYEVTKRRGFRIEWRHRIEDGKWGIRFWRTL